VEQIPSKYSHCYSGASDGARSFGLKVLDMVLVGFSKLRF
jgi:hypothetical protein